MGSPRAADSAPDPTPARPPLAVADHLPDAPPRPGDPLSCAEPPPAWRLLRPTAPLAGVGLHHGRRATAVLEPGRPGEGPLLLPANPDAGQAPLPLGLAAVGATTRCTTLTDAGGGPAVAMVEHLLAALAGLGVWDVRLRLGGGRELPALDGSALPWVRALLAAGLAPVAPRSAYRLRRPLVLRQGRAVCALTPPPAAGPALVLRVSVDFPLPPVGRQALVYRHLGPALFLRRLAPARTFGFLHEAAALRRAGLARGAGLHNTLVLGPGGPLNPGGGRFWDEAVRHKALDALGDLALLGAPLCATVRLHRCGHRLLVATLRRALATGALVRCSAAAPAGGHRHRKRRTT